MRDGVAYGSAIGSFIERVAMAAIASLELAAIELGMRLGLYTALARKPSTPAELANTADIDQRYACEWLEQQATAGIVLIESEPHDGDPDGRVFRLPIAHRECLLVPDSLACVAPLATFAVSGPGMLADIAEAYRAGTRLLRGLRPVDPACISPSLAASTRSRCTASTATRHR